MKSSYWIVIIVFIAGIYSSKICADKFVLNSDITNDSLPKTINASYIPSLKGQNINQKDLIKVFNDSTLLIWGTSELTVATTIKPFDFIPKNFGKSVLAIGHAGAQSFAALSFLASHKNVIKNKQIVFFVSSNWFCGDYAKGTHPEPFLEYFDYDGYDKSNIDEKTQNKLTDYYFQHFADLKSSFVSTSKFMNLEIGGSKVIFQLVNTVLKSLSNILKVSFMNPAKIETEKTLVNYEVHKTKINDFDSFMDSTKNIETKIFLKKCSNNSLGIDSGYFTKYCLNKIPFQLVPAEPFQNQELKDLEALLYYLKHENYKALIVLLPVNTLAYDCKPFNDFQKNIEQLVTKNEFDYLNLFVADSAKYKLGTCVDIMHTGPLSWIEINKKIISTFYPDAIRN